MGSACTADSSTPPVPTSLAEVRALELEYNTAVSKCLEERGWEVAWNSDGSPGTVGGPREQGEKMKTDISSCREEVDRANPLPTEFSAEVARETYDARVAQLQCIAELGYPLPEIPSFESVEQGIELPTMSDMVPEDVMRTQGLEIEQQCPSPWGR